MAELDRIYEELRAIAERLDTATDFDERSELTDRRQELRAEAQRLADRTDVAGLRARERELLRLIAAAEGKRVSVATTGLGQGGAEGGGGIEWAQLDRLNQRIGEGTGLPELREELNAVRARIAAAEAATADTDAHADD